MAESFGVWVEYVLHENQEGRVAAKRVREWR